MDPTERQNNNLDTTSIRQEGWSDTFDTLLLRLDPTSTLLRIELDMMGLEWEENNQKYIQVADPKLSYKGVKRLMIELRSRISVDKVLGNLEEKKINDITRETGEVVLSFLWYNSTKYDINSNEWESIEKIVRHNVYMFLRRAKDALQNKLIHESMKMQEISQRKGINELTQAQQNNGFSFAGLFKK